METHGKVETAILFRSERWSVVRLCRIVGSMERLTRYLADDLLHSDDHSQCRDLTRSRPHASDPPSRGVRRLARSGDEKRGCCLRTPETLRRSPDAQLSREQPYQPCGE